MATADPPPRVAIEGPAGNRIVVQLVGELRASGFDVITRATNADASVSPDGSLAGIDAVIRVTAESIEVGSVARSSGALADREVIRIAGADDARADVAVLRAEEIVRARLLSVEGATASSPAPAPSPAAPRDPSVAAPVVAAPPAAPLAAVAPVPAATLLLSPPSIATPAAVGVAPIEAAHWGLDAGAVVLLSPGGVPPAFDVLVVPRWIPVRSAMIRAFLAIPVISPDLASTVGKATASEWLVGASVDWNLLPLDAAWSVRVGAGTGAARLQTEGTANAGYVSSSGDAWTWLAFASVGASRRLGSPHTRIGSDVFVGASLPSIAVQFPDGKEANWGRPLVGISLALQVDAL